VFGGIGIGVSSLSDVNAGGRAGMHSLLFHQQFHHPEIAPRPAGRKSASKNRFSASSAT
jgi:hypothetical protein